MCCVQKNITWSRMDDVYCKIRLWFTSKITCGYISKHTIWCMYNISQNNWIDTFYNFIFTDEWEKSNHKTIELWDYTNVYIYTYTFCSLISICIITFFDVRTKLNNHILQYYDLKFTYEIKPLQIYCTVESL